MDNMFKSLDNSSREDVINAEKLVNPARSVFPYGCASIQDMNEGYLYPVDCFFTLPGDSLDIEWACYLEALNPFVERQYSGMKLSFHAYYNKCEHEWKGWKNFATRGRRGNISLNLPEVALTNEIMVNGKILKDTSSQALVSNHGVPNSLFAHLVGFPLSHPSNQNMISNVDSATAQLLDSHDMGDNTQVNRSFSIAGENPSILTGLAYHFNAIPFSMYQRVYRDHYLNQNLVKDNDLWFPDDEDDFVLPYASSSPLHSIGNSTHQVQNFSLVPNNYKHIASPGPNDVHADAPVLASMRCRQWNGDPFTTSTPFLERNGTTNILTEIFSAATNTVASHLGDVAQLNDVGVTPDSSSSVATSGNHYVPSSTSAFGSYFYQRNSVDYSLFSLLNFNQLQELAASTLWSRRNAEASGDYNSLIKAHYGRSPRSEDRAPTYIGGSVQRVEFDNVISQVETSTQPLGTITSIAKSGGRASISHFEVPDFGYVMILASLVPDTFYSQGLRPEFDSLVKGSELPWPEFANLQKENILKKRLWYTGVATSDNALIGFQERFLDYKYRSNKLLGHFGDYLDTKFTSMSYGRYFTFADMSAFSSIDNEFVTMSPYSVRKDMFSVPSQPHFVLQFGDNVRLVRCLPYASKEANFTNVA